MLYTTRRIPRPAIVCALACALLASAISTAVARPREPHRTPAAASGPSTTATATARRNSKGVKTSSLAGTTSDDPVKADVYVPPGDLFTDTVASAADSTNANVYVPPAGAVTDTAASADESVAGTRSWGLDWDSAGIGATAAIGAFLIALGGAAGLRRRQMRPAPGR